MPWLPSVPYVNNAAASGVIVDEDGLRALNIDPASWVSST
ncbi:hypothetical protein Patl1_15611 [Pistacia atlantica]|uniref:Uncharacterized protein n=1 Tax=Pistacia atlantica TaxID=434234 RepID=A0ACC1B5B2_9ROSI|nr:hypothetical protein Patl1_15611 [Pistacia atlantica]